MSRGWALASTGVVLGWLHLAIASEAPAQPLKLYVETCESARVPISRLVEVLSTELAPLSVEWVADATLEPTRCEVLLCNGSPNGAMLRVFHDGLAVSQRQLDLSDVGGDSRVRTLAAIVAETLNATEQNRAVVETSRPSVPAGERWSAPPVGSVQLGSGTVQPEVTANPRNDVAWHSGATLSLREYSRPGSPFFGTEVHLGLRRFQAALSLGRSQVTAREGDITHSFAVVATSIELTRFFRTPVLIPRVRFETGVAWAQSHANDVATISSTHAAALSAAMLEVVLRQRLVARTAMHLICLGGYSGGFTATENGVPRSSTSGWFASLGLGVDFDW